MLAADKIYFTNQEGKTTIVAAGPEFKIIATNTLPGGDDGPSPFIYDEQKRRWVGNPSKAVKVTQYMNSLKKRKARSGEQAKSMRALTKEDMKKILEMMAAGRAFHSA